MSNQRSLPPVTLERLERLKQRVTLQTLSTASGIPMTTLSEAQRGVRVLNPAQETARQAALKQLAINRDHRA